MRESIERIIKELQPKVLNGASSIELVDVRDNGVVVVRIVSDNQIQNATRVNIEKALSSGIQARFKQITAVVSVP